jgi:kynurenine formamidase
MSHSIPGEFTTYGGFANLKTKKIKSISEGGTSNTYRFSMEDHWGTHIDLPNHFFDHGAKINSYPANFWIFSNPEVITISLAPSELLGCVDRTRSINPKTDFLIIQCGWGRYKEDRIYGVKNPGLHPDLARMLRTNYPKLRAVGIDSPSISSYDKRDLGRQAHRLFLDPNGKSSPIVIVEDMKIDCDVSLLRKVFILPLRIESIDSVPCTIVGEFNG